MPKIAGSVFSRRKDFATKWHLFPRLYYYLSLKCSPSCLLCTGISDDFLGVNRHKSRSVSLVNRMYFLTFLTLLNQISPVAVNTGMVRRMMSTVATLRLRSSLVQLSVSCRFFGLSPSPGAQLASYRKLLSVKDSHSLLMVYFVLLPNEGNYLVLLLTDSKQSLGFRLGHNLSLWKLRTHKCQNQGKNAGWMLRLADPKLFQGFRLKPFLFLERIIY